MDGSLSINFSKNSTGTICCQLISPHIQHGLPAFSWFLYRFKMASLLSIIFSTNANWTPCCQLTSPKIQHGQLVFS